MLKSILLTDLLEEEKKAILMPKTPMPFLVGKKPTGNFLQVFLH
jgi:hypothetical protein